MSDTDYETSIPKEDEQEYRKWRQSQKDSGEDYDLSGYWLNHHRESSFGQPGHGPDTYKKPNHPTFSSESIYHNIKGNKGGEWKTAGGKTYFVPGETNKKNFTKEALQRYFDSVEPGVILDYDNLLTGRLKLSSWNKYKKSVGIGVKKP